MMRTALLILPVLACAAWALWPLDSRPVTAPAVVAAERSAPQVVAALDPAAFRIPLWVAPPAPPPPPAAAAPPPPLKLQLIAILRDGQAYKAALYDPETDTLTVVGAGDTIAGRAIERVGAADLSLKDNGQSRVLSLKTEGGTP